jgi:hypothetical protein
MAGSGRRGRRSRAQWRALVSAYEASGQSQREFCAQHEVSVSGLRHWQGRLAVDGGSDGRGLLAQEAPRWVPVRVLEAAPAGSGVVVVGAGGVRVEVSAGFDGATFERVLAVLGMGR